MKTPKGIMAVLLGSSLWALAQQPTPKEPSLPPLPPGLPADTAKAAPAKQLTDREKAVAKEANEAAKTEAAVYEQLAKIAASGLEPRELQKAQNNLSAMMFRELSTNNARAHSLGNYEMMLGSWREGLALPLKYEAVTSDDVKAVAVKYLTADRRSVVTLVPTPEASVANLSR